MKFVRTERKVIPADVSWLVEKTQLDSYSFPLVISPKYGHVKLEQWVGQNIDALNRDISQFGGVLLRGFNMDGQDDYSKLLHILSSDHLLEYKYKSTNRTHVGGNIYTSTEYPADLEIPLHNEMSYASSWPLRIVFYSQTVAEEKGATPLADSREIYKQIPAEIREEFERKNVMYTRYYGDLDLKWQDVFQTDSKEEVGAFCQKSGINYKWMDDNCLKTWQVCDAVKLHPVKKEMLWFNQAHLFHVSALGKQDKERLLSMVPEDELPRNAYFGDGSTISDDVVKLINDIYRENSVIFPWQKTTCWCSIIC